MNILLFLSWSYFIIISFLLIRDAILQNYYNNYIKGIMLKAFKDSNNIKDKYSLKVYHIILYILSIFIITYNYKI